MKKIFPIISVILTAALLIGVFTAVPFSVSAGSKPTFVVDNVEAEPGAKNVAVNVSLKSNPGVASILLDIGYDKSALTLKNFTYENPGFGYPAWKLEVANRIKEQQIDAILA